MFDKVRVAGVGMIPFGRPGRSESYPVTAERAARSALDDAGIPYEAVQQAYAGYVYGDSTAGQCALYSLGLSAIPVVNVNNNCSTGSSALWLARQAVGFEQMRPGALGSVWDDRPDPLRRLLDRMTELQGFDERIPVAAQLFGGAGVAYTDKYGTDPATFAKIAVKARRHAAGNRLDGNPVAKMGSHVITDQRPAIFPAVIIPDSVEDEDSTAMSPIRLGLRVMCCRVRQRCLSSAAARSPSGGARCEGPPARWRHTGRSRHSPV